MLSACSIFYSEDGLVKDNSFEYIKADQTKTLEIPEPLKHKNNIDYTAVPAIGEKAKSAPIGKDLKVVAPIQILAVLDNVRSNKESENPAIFITEDANFVWQTIIDMFKNSEIALQLADKANYVLETDWVALDKRGIWLGLAGADEVDDFRAKYRIKLTEGVLKGEKQIEVERIAAESFNDDTDKWESYPSFWQDSAEMLNLIISSYDKAVIERDRKAKSSVIAGFKVKMAKDDDDNAALVTSADMELVWDKLPKVLEALNFDINDRDRRLMTYFVAYEFEEPGFFASLFDSEEKPLPLETGDYQVTLRQLGELTAIVFRDGQGAPLTSDTMVKLYPDLNKLFGDKR